VLDPALGGRPKEIRDRSESLLGGSLRRSQQRSKVLALTRKGKSPIELIASWLLEGCMSKTAVLHCSRLSEECW
jgi:hypothetical protein